MPSASTTYQARWISEALGEYVGTRATFVEFVRADPPADARAAIQSDVQAYGHARPDGKRGVPPTWPRSVPYVATGR